MALNIQTSMAILIGLALAATAWYHIKTGKGLRKGKKNNVQLGTIVAVIAAVALVGAFSPSTINDSFIGKAVTFEGDGISFGTASAGTQPSSSVSSTTSKQVISTLSGSVVEAGSNSATAVSGIIKFYDPEVNPSSATAVPIDSVNLNSGTGSSTAKKLFVNSAYRVIFDGNGTSYYDKDFGVVTLNSDDVGYNTNTGDAVFTVGDVQKVATIDDMLDETSTDGRINGQTSGNHSSGTAEVGCSTGCNADGTLIYDESVGDQQWYLDISPSFSGAHTVSRNPVLHFKHDTTNPPEGDEYSQIAAQLRTGSDLGVPSDVTEFWKNELPIELSSAGSTDISGGVSSTYRITFFVTEANEDGNDDWKLHLDDLGSHLGKDIRLSAKATPDTVTYGGSQA